MISVKGLTVNYPVSRELTLNQISFDVKKGEVLCVLGRLNSGKTTLCRCLNGLIPKFIQAEVKGEVIIEGVNVSEMQISEASTKVGLILENPLAQITGYGITVEEEVAFGLENLGIPRKEMIKRIDYALKKLDLDNARLQNPFEISGGQQQRLAIASILAMKPSVLVLDEPTSQLDPLGTYEVFEELEKIKKDHAIILATQKVDLITSLADKVLLLHNGKPIAYDVPGKVLTNSKLLKKAGVKVPLIVELQDKNKVPLSRISFDYNTVIKNLKRLRK
jgi:energy-coupling factor transport system ATP-binding protein